MQYHSWNTNLDTPSYHPDSGALEGCQEEKKSETGRETIEKRVSNSHKIPTISNTSALKLRFTYKYRLVLAHTLAYTHTQAHSHTQTHTETQSN